MNIQLKRIFLLLLVSALVVAPLQFLGIGNGMLMVVSKNDAAYLFGKMHCKHKAISDGIIKANMINPVSLSSLNSAIHSCDCDDCKTCHAGSPKLIALLQIRYETSVSQRNIYIALFQSMSGISQSVELQPPISLFV